MVLAAVAILYAQFKIISIHICNSCETIMCVH